MIPNRAITDIAMAQYLFSPMSVRLHDEVGQEREEIVKSRDS